jgi:cytidine deaminase
MRSKEITIRIFEYDTLDELESTPRNLLQQARSAARKAYAPYSGYYVGAAVLLEDGTIVTGNNQENAAFPSGLCAERVALFYAGAHYPNRAVEAIAVSAADKNGKIHKAVSPCGACRQVMRETEIKTGNPVKIILDGAKIQVLESVESLLPLDFRLPLTHKKAKSDRD